MTEVIIPTTEEILSTMDAELYKARCIVLTGLSNNAIIFRIDQIRSFTNLASYGEHSYVRTGSEDDEVAVKESVAEILSRIARVEKDRL